MYITIKNVASYKDTASIFQVSFGRGGGSDLKISTLPLLSKSNFSWMLHYSNPACTHLHLGKSHLRDNYV